MYTDNTKEHLSLELVHLSEADLAFQLINYVDTLVRSEKPTCVPRQWTGFL